MGLAAIGAVSGLVQLGVGLYQSAKANKALRERRPNYEIPEEVKQNLTAAQSRALEGLPEAQRKQFVQNVQRSSQTAIDRTADRRSGLVGLAGVQQQEIDAYGQLLAQDSAAKRANELQADAARQNMANYKEREWEENQMLPYMERRQQAQAMKGAGIQNIFGGINQGMNMAMRGIHADQVAKALNQEVPNGGDPQASFAGANMGRPALSAMGTSPTLSNPSLSNQNLGIGMGSANQAVNQASATPLGLGGVNADPGFATSAGDIVPGGASMPSTWYTPAWDPRYAQIKFD